MSEKRRYGILWSKSMLSFAQCVWGLATYLVVLAGTVVLGAMFANGTARPDIAGALAGVFLGTVVNWMVFGMVEHGDLERMNG